MKTKVLTNEKCSHCGLWHAPHFMKTDYEGNYVCEGCLLESYYTCENCGDHVHHDDATWTEPTSNNCPMSFCPNCAGSYTYECGNCGGTHHIYEQFTVDGKSVCQPCFDLIEAIFDDIKSINNQ